VPGSALAIDRRARAAFAVLILVQAAHSVEECVYRLFDVFAPARFISGLFTGDLWLGFVLANAVVVSGGAWCYLWRVRPAHPSATGYGWFWACLEVANGVGHLLIAARRGAYFPGVATAPVLIAAAVHLGVSLTRRDALDAAP
jgi:hypothetical protein